MKFTEEMINEDEKRWHERDIITELGYCGNNMRDRKNVTNMDIRFYAYIMRKAHAMLEAQEASWIRAPYKKARICSRCYADEPYKFADDDADVYDYCPNCGARMINRR